MSTAILELRELTREFGPFRAVNRVTLTIARGSITGLIGPNGAGKTTLFNMVAGALKPTAGRVLFEGKDVTGLPADALFAQGLARTFQIPRPFRRMSVLENLTLVPPGQRGETVWGALFARKQMRAEEEDITARAQAVLAFLTLEHLAHAPAGSLSGGQMKLLELGRALMGAPRLILLDEPAAGVAPALRALIAEKIAALNRKGVTFVVIEHDMDFIMRLCDPVVAMAEGRLIFQGPAASARADPGLMAAYLGAPA